MDKFLGIGLKNAFGLWCLFLVFSLVIKTIFTKYEVEGLSDVIRAGAQREKGGSRMVNLTSPAWWINMFITTLLTMVFIYLIKMIFGAVQVPVVSDVVAGV